MKAFLLGLIFIQAVFAHADLDAHQQKGLDDTQKLLRDRKQRGEFIKSNKAAQDADDKASAVAATPADKDEMYNISAELTDKIAKETNGDPAKMQALMEEAQKNPEAFYKKYFNKSQQDRVSAIAKKSAAKPTVASPQN